MPKFSQKSMKHLGKLHIRLQDILLKAIEIYDFSIISSYRGKEEQTKLYLEGKTQLPWPNSAHNKIPAEAVDLAPYPIDWNDKHRFILLAGIIITLGYAQGTPLVWGGDWNKTGYIDINGDLGHFEMK